MDASEAQALVAVLQAVWPFPELSAPTAAIFASKLRAFPAAPAEKAVARLASSLHRFPSLAQLVDACREETRAAEPPTLLDPPPAELVEGLVQLQPSERRTEIRAWVEAGRQRYRERKARREADAEKGVVWESCLACRSLIPPDEEHTMARTWGAPGAAIPPTHGFVCRDCATHGMGQGTNLRLGAR